MPPAADRHWHNLSVEETADRWRADTGRGLDENEAEQRLAEHGPNSITTRKTESSFVRFLRQFHQPLIYILIGSGIITALLGEWIDSSVIFGVVLANAVVGYLQESKAVHALAALARTMTSEATVVRGGDKTRIPSHQVVPGDIVLLESGDKVPADLRLVDERGLQIDESALTGESQPVDKSVAVLDEETELASRLNMAYATTLVTHGQARGIVVATGDATEVGRISQLIASASELETPLTRKIAAFSHLLLYLILGLAAVTVAIGLIRGQGMFDMFMAAVALAVGAIPEGLPAAVTITLAIGVSRMARRKAIIRKLPAVETLGSTTVICSDKTGTLTENKMTVQAVLAGGTMYSVSGGGYDPGKGDITHEGNRVEAADHPALFRCLLAGVVCNDSLLKENGGIWQVQGDPTEGALLAAAGKGGLELDIDRHRLQRLDTLPFDSGRKYMATLVRGDEDGTGTLFVKGGVEVMLEACTQQLDGSGKEVSIDAAEIHGQVEKMAADGLRVLAFAMKKEDTESDRIDPEKTLSGLTFLGLQGMMDPPRQEAFEAVETCQRAGILVKMITGDHALTAKAIAGRLGIIDSGSEDRERRGIITGSELAKVSDEDLADVAHNTSVFARTTPEQKLRLVMALQGRNHVVAMTGDGVNDAPALKRADIGVAMGVNGTEVAKEAAAMVLTDDNFSSIEAAVEEGRGVFDNLTKYIVWTLPTNIGEGLVIIAAIFLGITLPILPVQILWINMTTAGFLGLMLAFEPKEPGIMLRPPRHPDTPILTRQLSIRIALVGLLLLISTFILFHIELRQGATLEQARTVAVNTFVVVELFYLFNCRSLTKSPFALGFFTNLWVMGGAGLMLLIQLVYTYLPVMNRLFQSAPISGRAWLYIACAGLLSSLVVEVEKKLTAQ
ncbi:MAG: cation-transporting P-type ATPase [Desulfobulbaceae bacterium]|jgi:Ca2+-transporting ATPase|nr:cation-transporting P-type ATPase [Desulfobulbaceae bacterium]